MAKNHKRFGGRLALCAAAIAIGIYISAGPSIALAKRPKPNSNTPQQPPQSQPQNPQLMAASQRLQAAQQALNQATAAFKSKYEVSDQWKSALQAQKDAQKNLSHVHAEVLAKLTGTDAYKSAITKQEQAAAALQQAHDDPADADPQQTADLANAVVQATQDKSKLENDALANDPDYATAESKLQTANKSMFALQSQEKSAMQQDPDWQKAHQNLVDAQTAYDKLVG
jgi:hypothetical protein